MPQVYKFNAEDHKEGAFIDFIDTNGDRYRLKADKFMGGFIITKHSEKDDHIGAFPVFGINELRIK